MTKRALQMFGALRSERGKDSLSSKSEFQDKLNLPRCVVLRKEPPKRGAADVQVWTSEDSAVKQVEELGPEL